MLTLHVSTSVGWLGTVAVALVLAVVGATSSDARQVDAVYRVLDLLGHWVLVPLSVASLLIGVVQSLGTPWGLVRHYWVLFKLVINVVATVVLLMYLPTLQQLSDGSPAERSALEASPVLHSGLAVALLFAALVLSIYKPRGRTRWAPESA